MKLVLITCAAERLGDVRRVLEQHSVHAYTEVEDARGVGVTGRRQGTRAFPGASALLFAAMPPERATELIAALRDCERELPPGEGVKAFVMDVTEAV